MSRNLEDWLEYYMQYTQNTEPPKLYHLWCGISAIASCLQRKTYLPWGHECIYPNMYIVLVGPPGGRKGTAMKMAKSIVQDLSIPMSSDCLGSVQTLHKELSESRLTYKDVEGELVEHRSLNVWSEEFQVFLGENNPQLVSNLTDLYDCPKKWNYASLRQGVNDLSNCWLNLVGAITPKLLQNKLSQDAVGGGLLSRLIFVVGYGKEKSVPLPFLSDEERALRDWLASDLIKIRKLIGEFRMSERCAQLYSDWYMDPESEQALDSDKFVGYNARRALHLRKLLLIVSASDAQSGGIISERHFHKAMAILQLTEREMPNAFFGLGRGVHSSVLSDIMSTFQQKGILTPQELTERFKMDLLPEDLNTLLDLLKQTGRIKEEKSVSGASRYTSVEEEKQDEDDKIGLLDETVFRRINT